MRWFFFCDDLGFWRWERECDGVTTQCAGRGFTEEIDCIADARRHGFDDNQPSLYYRQTDTHAPL